MRVLVATGRGQGDHPGDYCHTIDGELVTPLVTECCEPERCGCGRGFPGLASSRATTTALVVDRPDLDPVTLHILVGDALDRDGWRLCVGPDFNDFVADHVDAIVELAEVFPIGSILRRDAEGFWTEFG